MVFSECSASVNRFWSNGNTVEVTLFYQKWPPNLKDAERQQLLQFKSQVLLVSCNNISHMFLHLQNFLGITTASKFYILFLLREKEKKWKTFIRTPNGLVAEPSMGNLTLRPSTLHEMHQLQLIKHGRDPIHHLRLEIWLPQGMVVPLAAQEYPIENP